MKNVRNQNHHRNQASDISRTSQGGAVAEPEAYRRLMAAVTIFMNSSQSNSVATCGNNLFFPYSAVTVTHTSEY